MTRLALSSYDLWRDIVSTNTDTSSEPGDVYSKAGAHAENLRTRSFKRNSIAAPPCGPLAADGLNLSAS